MTTTVSAGRWPPAAPSMLPTCLELGHEVQPYRNRWMSGCCSPPNVAFSCWRGLASSVKARQRLYRRKVQGRASQLQRDVSPAFTVSSGSCGALAHREAFPAVWWRVIHLSAPAACAAAPEEENLGSSIQAT